MNWLKAPKTDRYFWWFHFTLWGTFTLINFFSRQFNRVETLEQGLVSFAVLIVVNTLLCLLLRELIHRFKLDDLASTSKVWLKLSGLVLIFGLLSAVLMTLSLGLYFLWAGYTQHLVFFMITVYQNWLIMTLVLGLWAIIYVVIQHIQTLNALKTAQQETQLKLKEAEMNNLTAQLNPHFLFNGLNNIRALINEDGQKARHMLTELSELLRYSLNSPQKQLTQLSEELDMVRAYVQLTQIQYEERLMYEEHISPEVNEALVPPLMIQLLIENAVRHGIDHHLGPGVLSLHVASPQTQLVITVSNPGSLQTHSSQSPGIGLENIRKRLHFLFGQTATFELSQNDGIVTAQIKLPFTTEWP